MKISELIEAAPSLGQPSGFASSFGKAFKQGVGMDPNKGLASNLLAKAADAAGLRQTAYSIGQTSNPTDTKPMGSTGPDSATNQIGQVKISPGTSIRDPKLGLIKVLPNEPGKTGVHLDTKRQLGFNVYVDPSKLGQQS